MSNYSVRGHWLIGGVKFLRTHYSNDTNELLLGSLPKAFHASLSDLYPIKWCDRLRHVELLRVIAAAHRDETAAYESLLAYGQAMAGDLANGALRPLVKVLTPKLLAKKLPNLWTNDHQDDGALESDISLVEEGRLPFKVLVGQGYEHVGIATLGWVKGFLGALGCKDVTVQQTGWRLAQPAPAEITCEVRWA